jgi:hypothetical protein
MPGQLLFLLVLAADPVNVWPQWGGPARDFQLPAANVSAWTARGPKQLWKRELGDGYASFVTDGKIVYTTFKRGTETVIIALDGATGATQWERAYSETPNEKEKPEMDPVHGTAPSSTPLLIGDRLYAVTFLGKLVAMNRAKGEEVWSHQLWREFGGTIVGYGYTNSPIAYKDTIILPVGGKGTALMAFRQSDGAVVWKGGDSDNAMASPVLIDVGGQKQVVTVMLKEVIGTNPDTGELLWRFPFANKTETNVSSAIWCGDLLLISAAYDSGTRALRLRRDGARTIVEDAWFNPRVRVHHTNLMHIGDTVYASSGDFGPAPMTAFKLATGEVLWQSRAFAKANIVRAGDKFILLDEEGKLGIVELSPGGMHVLAEAQELTNPAWTAPALSGSRLFLRDRHTMLALEIAGK